MPPKHKAKPKPKSNPKPKPKIKLHVNRKEMPGLTVNTSPSQTSQQTSPNSQVQSGSASPVRPPYSPITPTLSHARLATSATSSQNPSPNNPYHAPPRQTYTHSQPRATAISQPPPVPIKFDENPDVLALQSAISILQMQARNAGQDIQTLSRIKQRALADPEEFKTALASGEISSKSEPLFELKDDSSDDEDETEDKMDGMEGNEKGKGTKWEKIPKPQNIVRCPPINWAKYAVVGDSLDKLHKDQQERPTEGTPAKLQPDGSLVFGNGGQRRTADVGVAAPYQPGRDKIEKKKGGKR